MDRDQFGEFVCGYWGILGLKGFKAGPKRREALGILLDNKSWRDVVVNAQDF